MAHIAFADHAALGIVLRDAIRAVPDAVAAADAGFRAMQDQASESVFGIRVDWTPGQAGGIQAVVAPHREVEPLRIGVLATFDFTDAPPVHFERVAVLRRAGDFAAPAADALRHVEVEPVLFVRSRRHRFEQRIAWFCPLQEQQ